MPYLKSRCSLRHHVRCGYVILAPWRRWRFLYLSETKDQTRLLPTSSRQNLLSRCQRNTRTRYETYQNNTNLEVSSNVFMGRTVDQDVHAAFVEFRAKGKRPRHHAHLASAASSV
jgi:hypothetical protein